MCVIEKKRLVITGRKEGFFLTDALKRGRKHSRKLANVL